jgi:hypothetical protein
MEKLTRIAVRTAGVTTSTQLYGLHSKFFESIQGCRKRTVLEKCRKYA